ncbi:hypothetical protein EJF22_22305 [Pandoraea apista]|nr:hypothetical protein EJF22_22305 [Pandoraea apista]
MKLSALVKDFVEISLHRYDADSLDDEFTMIVERDQSYSQLRFESVFFDRRPYQESHRCAYHLRLVDGVVKNIRFDGTDPGKALFVGHLYGFERRLFQLYAAGTSLILDDQEQEISTYYRSSDY